MTDKGPLRLLLCYAEEMADYVKTATGVIASLNAEHEMRPEIHCSAIELDNETHPELLRELANTDAVVGIFWSRMGVEHSELLNEVITELKSHFWNARPMMIFFYGKREPTEGEDAPARLMFTSFRSWCRSERAFSEFHNADHLEAELEYYLSSIVTSMHS